jgi:hypothetical protein
VSFQKYNHSPPRLQRILFRDYSFDKGSWLKISGGTVDQSLARKRPAGSNPASIAMSCAAGIAGWAVAPATVLVLLLLGHGFGYDIWQAPPGQPQQIQSKVNYDPKLTDRFFESDKWSCPHGDEEPVTCRDGKPVLILNDPRYSWLSLFLEELCFELREWCCPDGCTECAICRDGKPVSKNTARCYSTSFNVKHPVHFSEARLLNEDTIDLLFHKRTSGAFSDFLRVRISNGKFSCLYWNHDGYGGWTTTRQKLTLDKKAYGKGDVIKGRIHFECVFDPKDTDIVEKKGGNPSHTAKVFGVFKTILE